ncbi:hypothetical protein J7E50_21520 [Pedobacter sp. ISL-68]|uniref:hypothetical protein n=1 Tax=unclassified Pedobacter TaxID=2628915 RepID=UPI001BE64469|nr:MULTISPECIES: hypothetical protein [unclassified Pedobacter]MBT2563781.1 hypothetical protein [Pedobacter sp. ISL-64]MBT2592813.1 hypothetical protein [Pedobacter sp. ISL-68]
MQKSFSGIIVKIVASIILIGFTYDLYSNCKFYIIRRASVGEIKSIILGEGHDKAIVQFTYYNKLLNQLKVDSVSLNNYDAKELRSNHKDIVISYTKTKAYLNGYNTPRALIFVFDIFMIFIMLFFLYPFKKRNHH